MASFIMYSIYPLWKKTRPRQERINGQYSNKVIQLKGIRRLANKDSNIKEAMACKVQGLKELIRNTQ